MAYRITRCSDAPFYPGQVVSDDDFLRAVREVKRLGGEPPLGERVPDQPISEPTLVLVEDISFTDRLEPVALQLGGYLEARDPAEYTALFHFPARAKARDFILAAQRQGYRVAITPKMFPVEFNPLEALREDAERIRRALRKPPLRPPWARD